MDTIQATVSIYYKIVGADLYGGPESVGYGVMVYDFDEATLEIADLPTLVETGKTTFAKTCKVPAKRVTHITRKEYKDNTEDLEGPDGVIKF